LSHTPMAPAEVAGEAWNCEVLAHLFQAHHRMAGAGNRPDNHHPVGRCVS